MTVKALVYILTASALLGAGVFLLAADALRLPTRKSSRAFIAARKREETRGKESFLDTALSNLALGLASGIKMNPVKKDRIDSFLAAAGIKISAEQHVASCLVKAGLVASLSIPALFIFPAMAPVILGLGAGVYIGEYNAPERRVREVREEIEAELPMFVTRIQSMLGHTRDVVAILESFRKNAGPALRRELTVTLADMQSGNGREALLRLETRVGSPDLSDIARGLTAVMEGNDPVGYWTSLSVRLNDKRRQGLMRMAHAVPGRINRLSFVLLVCMVLLYGTVICTELLSSVGVLFG